MLLLHVSVYQKPRENGTVLTAGRKRENLKKFRGGRNGVGGNVGVIINKPNQHELSLRSHRIQK